MSERFLGLSDPEWAERMLEALQNVEELEQFYDDILVRMRQWAGKKQPRATADGDPSDLTQLAMVKFFEAFEGGQVPCASVGEFLPYLRTLLNNTLTDDYRQTHRLKRGGGRKVNFGDGSWGEPAPADDLASPSFCAVSAEEHEQLLRAIPRLKDPQVRLAAEKVSKHWTYETLGAVLEYEKYIQSLPAEQQEAERARVKKSGERLYKRSVEQLHELMGGSSR